MSVDEQSKLEFSSILSRINRKFDIIHTKWMDEKNFEAKFRTQIRRENEDYNTLCDEWVDLFSAVTSTTWVKKISNTGPQIKFRKQYQCWTRPGEIQKELLFDPRRCKATVDVKVLNDNTHTRRKNKYIKQGLNIVVKLNFTHLHPTVKTNPFAFYVHHCEPQQEAPKLTIQRNVNIPQIINNIVEKLKDAAPKNSNNNSIEDQNQRQGQIKTECNALNDAEISKKQMNMVQFNQMIPSFNLQLLDALKLPCPSLTQLVMNTPQYEDGLMCQPLIYDATQMIPVSSSQFVQIHSFNLQPENDNERY